MHKVLVFVNKLSECTELKAKWLIPTALKFYIICLYWSPVNLPKYKSNQSMIQKEQVRMNQHNILQVKLVYIYEYKKGMGSSEWVGRETFLLFLALSTTLFLVLISKV